MKKTGLTLLTVLLGALSFAQTKIPIDSLSFYIGKNVNICSKVYDGRAFEKMTLLNLGAAYPKSPLTVVIPDKDRKNFSTPPEVLFKDKSVCVTGTIQEFTTKLNTRLEIVITKPEQIVIYDEQEGKIHSDKH